MDNQILLQTVAYALPSLLATIAGLVMVSIFRQRSPDAANLAMWCLIAMLLNLVLGTAVYAVLPLVAGNVGGDPIQMFYMAIGVGRQLIDAAATLGLVYAVFIDRQNDTDGLPVTDDDDDLPRRQ